MEQETETTQAQSGRGKAWIRPAAAGVAVVVVCALVFLIKPLFLNTQENQAATSGKLCLVHPETERSSFDLLFQSSLENWLQERAYKKIEKYALSAQDSPSALAEKNCEIVLLSDPQYEKQLTEWENQLQSGEKIIYAYTGAGKANPELKRTQMYGFDLRNNAFLAGYVASGLTKTGRLGYAVSNPGEQELAKAFKLGVEYYNLYKGSGIQILDWQENKNQANLTAAAKIPAIVQKQVAAQADIFFLPGSYQGRIEAEAGSETGQAGTEAETGAGNKAAEKETGKSESGRAENTADKAKDKSAQAGAKSSGKTLQAETGKTKLEINPEILTALGEKNLFIAFDMGMYRENSAYAQAGEALAQVESSAAAPDQAAGAQKQQKQNEQKQAEQKSTGQKQTGQQQTEQKQGEQKDSSSSPKTKSVSEIPVASLSALLEKTPNLFSVLPVDTSEVFMQIYTELTKHHQKLVTADTSFAGSGAWAENVGLKGQVSPVLRAEVSSLRKQLLNGELRIDQLETQLK